MERRLELIAEMTPAVWIHLIATLAALILGAFVLWRRKGDATHRLRGRIWVGLMTVAAVSSFWIVEINEGGFSPIHGLSVWTLFSLVMGVIAIRMRSQLGPWAIRLRTMRPRTLGKPISRSPPKALRASRRESSPR